MPYFVIEQNETSLQEDLQLLPGEIAQLYQIAQTGSGGSLNSLRDLLGIRSSIRVNCLSLLPLPILLERTLLYYRSHVGFHFRFSGEIAGEIYTFISEDQALRFIERQLDQKGITKRPLTTRSLNPKETAILAELATLVSNSFWRELASKTIFNWETTPPLFVADLSRSISYSAKVHNLDYLTIQFEYLIPILDLRIQLIILPAAQTLQKILTRLKQHLNPHPDVVDQAEHCV